MKPNYPNLSLFYNQKLKNLDLPEALSFALCASLLENNLENIGKFWRNVYLRNAIGLHTLPDYDTVLEIFKGLALIEPDNISCFSSMPDLLNSSTGSEGDPNIGFKNVREIIRKQFQEFSKDINSEQYFNNGQNRPFATEEIEQAVGLIRNEGYAVLKNFFNKDFISHLASLTSLIEKTENADGVAHFYDDCDNQRTYNLASKDLNYRNILENKTINAILEKLFDRNTLHLTYALSSFAANTINPGSKIGYSHIDSMVPDPIPPWLMRCLVTIPLVNTTVENGATLVVPGSHKLCKRPNGDFETEEVALIANVGDVLIWDGLIWHRAGANKSNKPRTVLLITFAASFFREIAGEEDHPQIIPDEIGSQFSTHVQNLMGFGRGVKEGGSHKISAGFYQNPQSERFHE